MVTTTVLSGPHRARCAERRRKNGRRSRHAGERVESPRGVRASSSVSVGGLVPPDLVTALVDTRRLATRHARGLPQQKFRSCPPRPADRIAVERFRSVGDSSVRIEGLRIQENIPRVTTNEKSPANRFLRLLLRVLTVTVACWRHSTTRAHRPSLTPIYAMHAVSVGTSRPDTKLPRARRASGRISRVVALALPRAGVANRRSRRSKNQKSDRLQRSHPAPDPSLPPSTSSRSAALPRHRRSRVPSPRSPPSVLVRVPPTARRPRGHHRVLVRSRIGRVRVHLGGARGRAHHRAAPWWLLRPRRGL